MTSQQPRYAKEVVDAYHAMASQDAANDFWVAALDADAMEMRLRATGRGGRAEVVRILADEFDAGIAVGFFRVTAVDARGTTTSFRTKLVHVINVGPKTPVMQRAKVASYNKVLKEPFTQNLAIQTDNPVADLTEAAIEKALRASGGAHQPTSFDFSNDAVAGAGAGAGTTGNVSTIYTPTTPTPPTTSSHEKKQLADIRSLVEQALLLGDAGHLVRAYTAPSPNQPVRLLLTRASSAAGETGSSLARDDTDLLDALETVSRELGGMGGDEEGRVVTTLCSPSDDAVSGMVAVHLSTAANTVALVSFTACVLDGAIVSSSCLLVRVPQASEPDHALDLVSGSVSHIQPDAVPPLSMAEMARLTNMRMFSSEELFDLFSAAANEQGDISRDAFAAVTRDVMLQGPQLSPDDAVRAHVAVGRLFDALDTDKSGSVDLKELASGVSLIARGSLDEKVRAAFDVYDLDKNGLIDQHEMKAYLTSVYRVVLETQPDARQELGGDDVTAESLAEALTQDAFDKADVNKDGFLSMEEFAQWYAADGQATSDGSLSRAPTSSSSSSSKKKKLTHTVHTTKHPQYPARAPVSNPDWDVPEPDYAPVDYTADVVVKNDRSVNPKGWADPNEWTPELATEVAARESNATEHGGRVPLGPDGKPRNPAGRTGMVGRGLLGKWGPNYAADPIVTRFDPNPGPHHGKLQMVAIQRADTKAWAIPGGMVDAGEHVSVTLKREFYEEAQNLEGEGQAEHIKAMLDDLFEKDGQEVFVGYVDDPRNTDHAWMETSAFHFHVSDAELAAKLALAAGDDAAHVRWLDVDDSVADFKALYASHRDMVVRAVQRRVEAAVGDVDAWSAALQRVSSSL